MVAEEPFFVLHPPPGAFRRCPNASPTMCQNALLYVAKYWSSLKELILGMVPQIKVCGFLVWWMRGLKDTRESTPFGPAILPEIPLLR
mmetsp:Transcript_10574/g.25840  ORF Transcript_10574/g.25840 Transcript_10574/m.25840 type:complete len:88 (+) Transcript_10574:152-415(+)